MNSISQLFSVRIISQLQVVLEPLAHEVGAQRALHQKTEPHLCCRIDCVPFSLDSRSDITILLSDDVIAESLHCLSQEP